MKSRLSAGLLLGCLVAAAGCSSSSSSTASPVTTSASPSTTTASPSPRITARNFQVATPNGQVSLSLDGQLPPNWPSQFPVPAGAKVAGSGSLGGASSTTHVGAYTTSQPAPDAFAFYNGNPELTTSGQRSAGAEEMIASTLGVTPAVAAKTAAQYPLSRYPSPPVALGAVATDAIFACHALTAEQSLSRYVPVYAYEFNDENAPELYLPPVGFPYGAAHASELQYLFSQTAVPHPASLSPAQQQLAAAMRQDWTSLAHTGVPAPRWPRFSPASRCSPWSRRSRGSRWTSPPSITARSGPLPASQTPLARPR